MKKNQKCRFSSDFIWFVINVLQRKDVVILWIKQRQIELFRSGPPCPYSASFRMIPVSVAAQKLPSGDAASVTLRATAR